MDQTDFVNYLRLRVFINIVGNVRDPKLDIHKFLEKVGNGLFSADNMQDFLHMD